MRILRRLRHGLADLARPSTWIAGTLMAATLVACELIGLNAMHRAIDDRITIVLVLLAAGSLGGTLLAVALRPLVTVSGFAARALANVVLVLFGLLAGNSLSLWLWHMVERFDYGEPGSAGHWLFALAASAAVNAYLFVAISAHVLMPQALVPVVALALWLARRRPATLPGG